MRSRHLSRGMTGNVPHLKSYNFSIKNEDFDTKQKTQTLFTELRKRLSQLVTYIFKLNIRIFK